MAQNSSSTAIMCQEKKRFLKKLNSINQIKRSHYSGNVFSPLWIQFFWELYQNFGKIKTMTDSFPRYS